MAESRIGKLEEEIERLKNFKRTSLVIISLIIFISPMIYFATNGVDEAELCKSMATPRENEEIKSIYYTEDALAFSGCQVVYTRNQYFDLNEDLKEIERSDDDQNVLEGVVSVLLTIFSLLAGTIYFVKIGIIK